MLFDRFVIELVYGFLDPASKKALSTTCRYYRAVYIGMYFNAGLRLRPLGITARHFDPAMLCDGSMQVIYNRYLDDEHNIVCGLYSSDPARRAEEMARSWRVLAQLLRMDNMQNRLIFVENAVNAIRRISGCGRLNGLFHDRTLYFSRIPDCGRAEILWARRSACVDRIYKAAYMCHASDAVPFAAVRLMDRYFSAAGADDLLCVDMSIIAMACFSLAHKCIGADSALYWKCLWQYAQSPANEAPVLAEGFCDELMSAEMTILRMVDFEPMVPVPHEYIATALPHWRFELTDTEGRVACMMCAALLYASESTTFASAEIAVAAALLAKAPETDLGSMLSAIAASVGSGVIWRIQHKMLWLVDMMFRANSNSGFERYYADCKPGWVSVNK